MRYPKEAVVFEVVSRYASPDSRLRIGEHVEAAGPCCFDTDRAWTCGVLALNGCEEEDEYQWACNLRPLTEAARQMLALMGGGGRV